MNLDIQEKELVSIHIFQLVKFNQQFLSRAVLAPSFVQQVLHWTPRIFKELNEYWKEIGDDVPIDFSIWINKFTTEMIFQLIVGIKVNSMAKYFNQNVESSKKIHVEPNPIGEEIENFAVNVDNDLKNLKFALVYPAFIRHTLLKKRNNKMHESIIKTTEILMKVIDYRRNEIEVTPVQERLRGDMLTSFVIIKLVQTCTVQYM